MPSPKKLDSEKDAALQEFTVRLLGRSSRLPVTPVEQLAVSTLRDNGPTPLPMLVERVAREIYLHEIRAGAWTLDIGLFGSRLFARDVARELLAADGILWKIQPEEESIQ